MSNLAESLKLIYMFYLEFISAPRKSDEANSAYDNYYVVRNSLAHTIGWKNAMIYGEHMEHLAARKHYGFSKDKFQTYLTMRSKSVFEQKL